MSDSQFTLSLRLRADAAQAKKEIDDVGKRAKDIARQIEQPAPIHIPKKVRQDMARPASGLVPSIIHIPRRIRRDLTQPSPATPGIAHIPRGSQNEIRPTADTKLTSAPRKTRKDVATATAAAVASEQVPWIIRADGRPAIAEAEKTRQQINQIGQKLQPWRVQMMRPAGVAGVSGLSGQNGRDKVGIISTGRRFDLRPVNKAASDAASARAVRAVTMTINADGSPAKKEARDTREKIDAEGVKAKPWRVKLQEDGGGAYNRIFRGFGGDISRATGMDKIGAGMKSGLGKSISWVSAGFSVMKSAAGFAFAGIWSGLKIAGGLMRSALLAPIRLASGAFKALGIAAAGALAGVYAGLKALGPAADMQRYTMQLGVLLKNAGKARQRLAELSKYAKETNYSPKQVIEAANLMEAFGFYSLRNLKLAGDAANSFGKELDEIVRALNYMATGRGGEAFESLARIGIKRQDLAPFGVKFKNTGELISEPMKALDAVLKLFEKRFGGMTKTAGNTWKGAIQQLGGEVYNSFAVGFQKALIPLTKFVKGRAIPLVESIGTAIEKIDWARALGKPLAIIGGMSEMIRRAMDPKTAATGTRNLKSLATGIWTGLKDVVKGLPAVGMAFLRSMAGALEKFVGNGGLGKVLNAAWHGLKLSWEFGASLLSQVLQGFSSEFQSNLKIISEALIPGGSNPETKRRDAAEKKARSSVFNQMDDKEYQRVMEAANSGFDISNWVKKYLTMDRSIGDVNPITAFRNTNEAVREQKEKTALNYMLAQPGQGGAEARGTYNGAIRRGMDFDDQKSSPFYRDPTKLSKEWEGFKDALGEIKFNIDTKEVAAAVVALRDTTKAALSSPVDAIMQADRSGGRLRAIADREESLRERRDAITGDKRATQLLAAGWNKDGTPKRFESATKDAAADRARVQYGRIGQRGRGEIAGIDRELARLEKLREDEQKRINKPPVVTPQAPVKPIINAKAETEQKRINKPPVVTPQAPVKPIINAKDSVNGIGALGKLEKGIDDVGSLLAQQKLVMGDLLTVMQGIDRTLKIVMGV